MTKQCSKCGHDNTEDALFCPRCGNKLAPAGGDPLLGTVVADRYLLVEKLGEGRSGVIYRGEHTTLRKKVAVKILHQQLSEDEAAIERFRREATTVGEIDNDHILQVMDFGRAADQRLFFAMELLEGEAVSKLIEREGKLPVQRVVDIITQAGEALMEAHGLGYVHRDLRPRNIFLTKKRGRTDFVKLLDFGLSKLVVPEMEPGTTVMGLSFGDPRYISPEQAKGDAVDRRTDLYSLGVVAYEMLTGTPPFTGARASDIIGAHISGKIPSVRDARPECPAWLDAVIQRALAKNADDRFITVLRMVECLKAEKAPEPLEKPLPDTTEPFPKPLIAPFPDAPPAVQAAIPAPMPGSSGIPASDGRTIAPGGLTASAVAEAAKAELAKAARDPAKTIAPGGVPPAVEPTTIIPGQGPSAAEVIATAKTMAPGDVTAPTPATAKTNGTGPHGAVPSPATSDSRKSKKQQKAEKRAEEQKKRTGSKSDPTGNKAVDKPKLDNWWPPERKAPDESVATKAMPTIAEPGSSPAAAAGVSAKAVAEASAGVATLPTAPQSTLDDATTLRNLKAPHIEAKVEVRPEAPEKRPGKDDGRRNQTGEHEALFFDTGRHAALAAAEPEFEDEPATKRNIGLIAGLSVGGVLVVGLIILALVGKSSAPKEDGPKRSYDQPAVSAVFEGKEKKEPPKVEPAAAPAPEVKKEEPPPAPAPAVVEEKKPEPIKVVEEKKPEPIKVVEEKKPEPIKVVEEKKPEPIKVVEEKRPEPKPEPKREPKEAAKASAAPPGKAPKGTPNGFSDPFADKGVVANQAEAFIKFGRQKLNSGDITGASTQFTKAREIDGKNADAFAGLGECAFEQGDYNLATVYLKQAVKLAPRKTRFVVLLGQAYYKLGRTKDAVAEYKRALKIDPKNQEASQSLEVAERKLSSGG